MTASVSQKLGSLPYLSAVWDFGPLSAAVIMFIADFGIICALMYCEGIPPWQRQHYKTFAWNDTIFIPLYMAMVVVIMQDSAVAQGFYTEQWWHATLLSLTFVVAILIEVVAVRSGLYTLSQELSPSKLWHTFISGIVGYWLISPLIPILLSPTKPTWAMVGILVAVGGALYNVYRDMSTRPFPYDTHLEGTYVPWRWSPRRDTRSSVSEQDRVH